jgi:hypothetical protein
MMYTAIIVEVNSIIFSLRIIVMNPLILTSGDETLGMAVSGLKSDPDIFI